MFRALLAQPALHKRYLVYCVRVMSVVVRSRTKATEFVCYASWLHLVQPTDITRTQYTKYRLCNAS
jgi:hypothetical protein